VTVAVVIVVLGLLIGAILGGLGGGGAILTVPALVYIVGQSAQEATTSSLVIVGLASLVGIASYLRDHRVRWGISLAFGLGGIPGTWFGSYFNQLVPATALLIGFAVVMLTAALAMVTKTSQHPGSKAPARTVTVGHIVRVIGFALAAGFLTGFFGVGGGFVIVPMLVIGLHLPMRQAVGTSLAIIGLNSATALMSRATVAHFDWSVIVPFTIATMIATAIGKRGADHLPAAKLQRGFALLLVLVAVYTAGQSIVNI